MTTIEKKAKILSIIAARGHCSDSLYYSAAQELLAEGKIKRGDYFSVGGNRTPCWVAA